MGAERGVCRRTGRQGRGCWRLAASLALVIGLASGALSAAEGEEELLKVALESADGPTAQAAVRRLEDPRSLARVLWEAPLALPRNEAMLRLRDPAELIRVAQGHPFANFRFQAVERIDDQAVLAALATSDPERLVRRQATLQLADTSLLLEIATGDPSDLVRTVALSLLRGDEQLLRVVTGGGPIAQRKTAAGRLESLDAVRRALREVPDRDLRVRALEARSADELTTLRVEVEDAWTRAAIETLLAGGDPSTGCPDRMTWEISPPATDVAGLARVARSAPGLRERLAAVEALSEPGVLAALAKSDGEPAIRRAATARVRDPEVLRALAGEGLDPATRRTATLTLLAMAEPPRGLAAPQFALSPPGETAIRETLERVAALPAVRAALGSLVVSLAADREDSSYGEAAGRPPSAARRGLVSVEKARVRILDTEGRVLVERTAKGTNAAKGDALDWGEGGEGGVLLVRHAADLDLVAVVADLFACLPEQARAGLVADRDPLVRAAAELTAPASASD